MGNGDQRMPEALNIWMVHGLNSTCRWVAGSWVAGKFMDGFRLVLLAERPTKLSCMHGFESFKVRGSHESSDIRTTINIGICKL